MMERDNHAENAVAFTAREELTVVEKPTCRHCRKYGHKETNCYELVSYPLS